MERQTSLLLLCVILFVCSATVFAGNFFIVADFVETKEGDKYGYMTGKLYYKYDSSERQNSRLRLEYDVGEGKVSNLYNYAEGAMYSMCDVCTGIRTTEMADPWYFDRAYYTKTDKQEGGKYWYMRTDEGVTDKVGKQVLMILMDDESGDKNDIKKIDFADGRHFTLSNVEHKNSISSDKFVSAENCPTATCPIYADLIFVLDNSGSVNGNEWGKTVGFVQNVIDTFTFGSKAVEGAIIQFNGAGANHTCKKNTVSGCSLCVDDYDFKQYEEYEEIDYNDCHYSRWGYSCNKVTKRRYYTFPGYATATIVAGKNNETVTADPDFLKSYLNNGRPDKIGNTCQGYGLELAMDVLDKSSRRKSSKIPQAIIIAVTDGEDQCPNKTANAAEKLKTNYSAFVIEVGVGMSSDCDNYHKKFLQRIASKAGSSDNPAYYDVSDYDAIHKISEELFKPLCEDFSSECGPDCLGFCGCGKCFCPNCYNSDSSCYNITCRSDESSSTGCAEKTIPCPRNDTCKSYICNGKKIGDERCEVIENNCAEMMEANPQKCRVVSCDTLRGGCYIEYDDDYCQNEFAKDDLCVEFVCATSDELITPGFEKSGCRLLFNKTKEKEIELKDSLKDSCFAASCDPLTGNTEEIDLCPSRLNNTVCYSSKCTFDGSGYQCEESAKNRPEDTLCTQYECVNETVGWVGHTVMFEDDCKQYFIDSGIYTEDQLECKIVSCSDERNACIAEHVGGCNAACKKNISLGCIRQGYEKSDVENCFYVECDRDYQGNPTCKERMKLNCLDNATLIQDVFDINTNRKSGKCCSVACGSSGHCTTNCENKPYNDNLCLDLNCTEISTGIWKWKLVNSTVANECHNNGCYERACNPEKGCIDIKEICESQSKTNKCYKFICNKTDFTCNFTSLLNRTTCTKEECENGKKVMKPDIEKCALTDAKCVIAKCIYHDPGDGTLGTSECVYDDLEPPDDDPCLNYTCNNVTGEWTSVPKCDDGKYCTENVCTVFGECKFPDVTCQELSMENYPCFQRLCKEDRVNSNYVCYRKLLKGAYIDICGNCIIENNDEELSGSSSSSSGYDELVSCTNAPPKPLLTEGLAAASIALIILAAVVIGAAVTASGVMGTKTLISRAKSANNTSAHTNPLFETAETEMTNPAFAGTAI